MKDRVTALRQELRRQGLSGFIIPHADEFQNEYLPSYAERLAWLTGFTGSAGTAVVLPEEAAIFVDGRYVLQVRNQVDSQVFVSHHLTEHPLDDWLASVLKPGQKVGFDPWLHTLHEVDKLQAACEKAGGEFIACEPNPLDVVWADRPASPLGGIVPHPHQYAGKGSAEKRDELARKLKSDWVDAAVLTAPDSIAWLLNIRGGDVRHTPLPLCFAVLRSDGTVMMFVDQRKVTPAVSEHLTPGVFLHAPKEFGVVLDRMGTDWLRVLCDPEMTAWWVFTRLEQAGAVVVQGKDPCAIPKACKNPIEVQGARQAHQRDGVAVCQFLAWLAREGPKGHLTELTAQEYLDARRCEKELWQDLSFPTISAAGPNGAIVHYRATDETNRLLTPGSLYLVDSGAQYLDGTTDITRTVSIGPPTAEYQARYTQVLKGHVALATVQFPKGTTGTQLDGLARLPLWESGLDYDHGTGHGVGSYLGVHEGPQRISKATNAVPLQPGMILSNEPGYYKAGEYGIRIENLMVVVPCSETSDGHREFLSFETLTLAPFDRALIDPALLTQEEKNWINAYHARVHKTLAPLMDAEMQGWLGHATSPI